MIHVWYFAWLLTGAGFQVSDPYPNQLACEGARIEMERTMTNHRGRPVEKVYMCMQAQN